MNDNHDKGRRKKISSKWDDPVNLSLRYDLMAMIDLVIPMNFS